MDRGSTISPDYLKIILLKPAYTYILIEVCQSGVSYLHFMPISQQHLKMHRSQANILERSKGNLYISHFKGYNMMLIVTPKLAYEKNPLLGKTHQIPRCRIHIKPLKQFTLKVLALVDD
uniref:Uncharacterized protein n=1 Tax=Pyxicephalus adspersus TaxID=30357 RepID=A0AAV3AHU4_PYXAD|nr:TPA: hypothetical protein GDO54_011085 [Pyxicephalus adspersus]